MTLTSRHLTALAEAARAGAHVVLGGHLHDEVLLDGRVVVERWAIEHTLLEAGLDAVVFADAASGLRCVDQRRRERVARLLADAPSDRDAQGPTVRARFGTRDPLQIATAARTLLCQRDVALACVLDDVDLLIDRNTENGRAALALLRRAVAEAECRREEGFTPMRNLLVVLASPGSPASRDLAALPGVRAIDVGRPDRGERAAALKVLAPGFHDVQTVTPAVERGLDVLANTLHGWSLREHEQLRRISHEVEISPARPGMLVASMPGRRGLTPIHRVGVEAIDAALVEAIVGQPAALEQLHDALVAARAPSALRPPGGAATRPLMTALMHGPTGVGKTEAARTLARVLFGSERALVRVDCAELRGPHDLARLTGAPPGYVGHEAGGMLTEPLRRQPGAVVLFDEFEKADPGLGELLLAVLDDGRLTDGRGETVHFGEAILLLTTNVGATELREEIAGGALSATQLLTKSRAIVKDRLSHRTPDGEGLGRPELWSRLQDAVVGFDMLRTATLEPLLQKYCGQIAANLADELDVEPRIASADFVQPFAVYLGADGTWDGRTVAKLARELIEQPLRRQLAGRAGGSPVIVMPGSGGTAEVHDHPRSRTVA